MIPIIIHSVIYAWPTYVISRWKPLVQKDKYCSHACTEVVIWTGEKLAVAVPTPVTARTHVLS